MTWKSLLKTAYVLALCFCYPAAPASAQRAERPTGQEVAQRAAEAKLLADSSLSAEEPEASFNFILADLQIKDASVLEGGAVIGVLEVTGKGGAGAGRQRYNLFLAKPRGQWRLYVESGKKIVGEIERVEVTEVAEMPKNRQRGLKVQRAKPGAPRPGTGNGFAPQYYPDPYFWFYYCMSCMTGNSALPRYFDMYLTGLRYQTFTYNTQASY